MLSPDILEKIDATFETMYNADGSVYAYTAMYFHTRFPNHTPVFCGYFYTIHHPDGLFICALEYGSRYAVPIFNHAGEGAEAGIPGPCDWYVVCLTR